MAKSEDYRCPLRRDLKFHGQAKVLRENHIVSVEARRQSIWNRITEGWRA